MTIGVIGFGELAACFAQGLKENVQVVAFDKNKKAATIRAKDINNVELVDSIDEILAATKYIMVAVPGKYDEEAFEPLYSKEIGDYVFMDFSTALPDSKNKISVELQKQQAKYVDVAVMGSAPKLLHKTPLLISGNGSNEMLSFVSTLDMDIKVCGEYAGRASTIKLCRSVFMKGLPALLIETHRICEKYDVEEEVFDSIYKNLVGQSFENYLNRLVDGAYRHWKRQKEELEECIEMASAVQVNPDIIHAAVKIFESLGEPDECRE